MNIISYRYTNTFKQLLLIVCMLYFILCATVIAEVVIFNVPGYEVNVIGGLLLYAAIFAVLLLLFLGYKFCYTLYDDETIIYYNKLLKKERSIIEKEIKNATTENSLYTRAARPVIKAKKLLIQAENYTKLEEIESLYEDAKARHEQTMEDARIEAERVEAEKKAHAAKIRAEKAARK